MAVASITSKLLIFILIHCFPTTYGALDHYIPALRERGNANRDELIETYFHLGLQQIEIVAFLTLAHGITISLRQLKRVLQSKGLRRRGANSPLGLVIRTIQQEIEGSGKCVGYRAMWQRLRNDHKIGVSRETVRLALRIIDPDGVAQRLRRRLRRRQYKARGPNFLWHIDGYDKLKPFGFCVHGCIDGFSRRIMWLEVASTNNDPRFVAKYFLDTIRQIKGAPSIVRADYGTENVKVAGIQRFLRRDGTDSFAGINSFMYGKSVSNQRIEAWWGQLRKSSTDWWINYFKDLRDRGLYSDSDILHVECLKFCYMPVIRAELQRAAIHWNVHRIRPSTNPDSPPGRPDSLFFLPSLVSQQTRDCKHFVDESDVDVAEDLCCQPLPPDCVSSFVQLATILMEELNLVLPNSPESAEELYLRLLEELEDLLT